MIDLALAPEHAALVAGALSTLSFAPYNIWPLGMLYGLVAAARNLSFDLGLRRAARGFAPTTVADATGVDATTIGRLARDLVAADERRNELFFLDMLEAGYHVIMRPHYQSNRQTPEVIAALRGAFEGRERFEYVDRQGETESILRSDILVSDWSAMALEYGLVTDYTSMLVVRDEVFESRGIERRNRDRPNRRGRTQSSAGDHRPSLAIHTGGYDAGDHAG